MLRDGSTQTQMVGALVAKRARSRAEEAYKSVNLLATENYPGRVRARTRWRAAPADSTESWSQQNCSSKLTLPFIDTGCRSI